MPDCKPATEAFIAAAIDRAINRHNCYDHKDQVACSMVAKDSAGYGKAKEAFDKCQLP